jgi:hypothetical protein
MNAALFRKELRDLLPWGVLALALALSNVAELMLAQIDLAPLGQTFGLLNEYTFVIYWFVAFAIGTGLAIREHDDRTLAFLDGLPVTRSRVFLIKCTVMALLVLIGPLLDTAAIGVFHLLSRGSLDRALHPALLAQALAVQALLLMNGLMLGAAFGRLRSLTWAAAGLAAAALILYVQRVPRAAVLNPLSLLDWQWTSAGIFVDGQTVATQLAATAVAGLVAWRGFVSAGKGRGAMNLSGPLASAVVVAVTVVSVVAVIVMVMRPVEMSLSTGQGDFARYEFPTSPPAQTTTRHFRISYPAYESEAALALAEQADAVFERVHALLGLPLGEPIDVDASGSMPNTHGTAFLGRIQMQLESDGEVLAVLAHETAHVAARRVAGEERDWLWRPARVLNEGLASWVETRFRERVERADERLLVLAAMHSRRELIIEELADPVVLQQLRDETIMYAAGEALIAALVRVYGEGAVARLLQAFDDPRLPRDLYGVPLWQSTFQLAGFDLAAVVDEFYRGIEEYAAMHAERLAALPRPRVVLVRSQGAVGAMAVVDSPRGAAEYDLMVRFRPSADSPLTDYQHFTAVANEPVWPRGRAVLGGRLCVQPGVQIGAEVLYEGWTCLPTSEAVELDAVR